jgi:hypothetical protein
LRAGCESLRGDCLLRGGHLIDLLGDMRFNGTRCRLLKYGLVHAQGVRQFGDQCVQHLWVVQTQDIVGDDATIDDGLIDNRVCYLAGDIHAYHFAAVTHYIDLLMNRNVSLRFLILAAHVASRL